jgi:hypothetical protein
MKESMLTRVIAHKNYDGRKRNVDTLSSLEEFTL